MANKDLRPIIIINDLTFLPRGTKIIVPTVKHWFHYEVISMTEDKVRLQFKRLTKRNPPPLEQLNLFKEGK